LYMAAVASLKHSPEMKEFYQRLKLKGKPSKVALVAIMNKLIAIISSVIKRRVPWMKINQINA
ncbi:IS110 family transposase, partial [Thiotrichales bacterium 19X7-9]|nr:IS110 family transposase [Thiotrichales bacterium 19X7-9]